jgi:DNA mismatch endonuclease, patch repair protein
VQVRNSALVQARSRPSPASTDRSGRSALMRRIKGADTGPECSLRRLLWTNGLRYRKHLRVHGVRPDLVFPRQKIAVFVDGCFWHGCPEHYVLPRSRRDFWLAKLDANTDRDRRQTGLLQSQGWLVLRFWEHEVEMAPLQVAEHISQAVSHGVYTPASGWIVTMVEPLSDDGQMERWHLQDRYDQDLRTIEVRVRSTRKWPRKQSRPE